MAYAPANRAMYDADSHIMELPDFLQKYADPELRKDIPAVSYSASLVTDEEVAEIMARGGRHTEEHVAEMIAWGDNLIERSKEIQALGAFDGRERSKAVDMLGFKKQLVFATHSVTMPFSPSSKISPKLRYGAARAHNRHMVDFCAHDSRLMGVAVVPLDEPALALEELEFALKSGAKAIWVPHHACGGRSPGHVEFDPFWTRLVEANIPFVMHVGGSPLQLDKAWINNGRPPVKDWMGGGENLRTKDMAVLHQGPETFLSMMLIDGVFERFPKLRGGCIELGAGWVPAMLVRLDWTVQDLEQDGCEPGALYSQAVRAAYAADGIHAVCIRGRRRSDRSVKPGAVPVLDRLPAHRGRPESNRALRDVSRRSLGTDPRPLLLGKFSAHFSRSARVLTAEKNDSVSGGGL